MKLLNPPTFLLLGLLLFVYLTGYKGTIGLFIVLCIILALIYFNQNKLLYMPVLPGLPRSPSQNGPRMRHPSEHNLTSQQVHLNTSDGVNIRGWHLKHPDPKRLIVYFHENAGNIGTRLFYVKEMVKRTQADVIMVAYRGYSDSQGQPSEKGLKKDSQAVLEYSGNYAREKKLDLYVLGRSLGGAVTINISTNPLYAESIKGIILQNTFTSISDMIDAIMPALTYVKFLQTNHWPSINLIGSIDRPILFIKSLQDELVPPKHMNQLVKAAKSSPLVEQYEIPLGTHNSSWDISPSSYFNRLLEFFQKVEQK